MESLLIIILLIIIYFKFSNKIKKMLNLNNKQIEQMQKQVEGALSDAKTSLEKFKESSEYKELVTNAQKYTQKTKEKIIAIPKSKEYKILKEDLENFFDETEKKSKDFYETLNHRYGKLTTENWYLKAAESCEDISDAIQRESNGTSKKIVNGVIGKVGAIGTSAGIFSIAAALGTASTGTAIGSLTGAAFTSSALAWLGGSVAIGGAIVAVASIAGGIGAIYGIKKLSREYLYGEKRDKEKDLSLMEKKIVESCISLSCAFRKLDEEKKELDYISAKALYKDALRPIYGELKQIEIQTYNWKPKAKSDLENSIEKFKHIILFLNDYITENPIKVDTVSAVTMQLLSDKYDSFDEDEELVLKGIKELDDNLEDESNEKLAKYIQSMEPSKLQTFQEELKTVYKKTKTDSIATGLISAVILQLFSNDIDSFCEDGELVLDALRRSNNSLTDATNEELSEYIQSLEPNQIQGLHNNIKGIYFELKFKETVEDGDSIFGDNYRVELFEETNHAGADIKLINELTGEIKEFQLKATDNLSYINNHYDRYDYDVIGTTDISEQTDKVLNGGETTDELNQAVSSVFEQLNTNSNIASSMSIAAVVSLAKNINVLLKTKEEITDEEKSKLLQDGVIAAGVAGVTSLIFL